MSSLGVSSASGSFDAVGIAGPPGGKAFPSTAVSTASATSTEHRRDFVTTAKQRTVVDNASVSALLERGRRLATPALRAAVNRLEPPMDTVAAYHFGWIDARGLPAEADGGKAVRPSLALLSAEAAGAPAEMGIPGAVAVELVHNFSLLHDDLMDGDEQRRHRDTVWKVHGSAQAILVGDALFALANDLLLELDTREAGRAARRLARATRKLIDGQAQDISYEHRERVTVEECLEMEGNKTGALLACAVSIGAVLGGADERTADVLESYGHHLGLAFQAVDDVLGIWGDPEATGKRAWSDLRQRKKSMPVCAALAAQGPAAERLTELMRADAAKTQAEFEDFDEAEFAARAALIEEAGGREWTTQEAQRQHATALAALESIDMPLRVREQLAELADFVVVRQR
jgi:geranylgeranyl diphosphate synthase type I